MANEEVLNDLSTKKKELDTLVWRYPFSFKACVFVIILSQLRQLGELWPNPQQ